MPLNCIPATNVERTSGRNEPCVTIWKFVKSTNQSSLTNAKHAQRDSDQKMSAEGMFPKFIQQQKVTRLGGTSAQTVAKSTVLSLEEGNMLLMNTLKLVFCQLD